MELGLSRVALLIKRLASSLASKAGWFRFFLNVFSFLKFKIAGGSGRREYIKLLQRQGEVEAPWRSPMHPAGPRGADYECTLSKGSKCHPKHQVFSDDLFAARALDKPLGPGAALHSPFS